MTLRLHDKIAPAPIAAPPRADVVAAARAVAEGAARRADREDRDGGFPAADVAELARTGLLAAPVPTVEGGIGLGTEAGAADLRAVLTWVGRGSLALGRIYEGHVNAVQLVARYAAGEARARLMADAAAGHLFGVWNTEAPGRGPAYDAGAADPVLSGAKTYASGAGFVTRGLVTAGCPDGVRMLVAVLEPGERADLAEWQAHGMRASATGTVDLAGLSGARVVMVGEPGDYFAQPHFSAGAWRFLAVQLGGVEAVFEAWLTHLRATGRGEDPHQLARLGEGAVAVETARLWIARAAALASDPQAEPGSAIAYVNLARAAVERAALDVLERAQRSVGLQGFLRTHPLERLMRDLATYLRQPGPDRALCDGARHVLLAEAGPDFWRA